MTPMIPDYGQADAVVADPAANFLETPLLSTHQISAVLARTWYAAYADGVALLPTHVGAVALGQLAAVMRDAIPDGASAIMVAHAVLLP